VERWKFRRDEARNSRHSRIGLAGAVHFDLYTLLKKHEASLVDAKVVLSKGGTINGWNVFTERLFNLPVRMALLHS
jgi:hypothetical protein